ncbi:hypothetical protein AA103196_2257 [Ameyamaea chiangmaiensis NBRC 103196]|nr:hypothetical protein AA103196_2257 [Ameyamaea chiangmaiensis NBRC 103196]
MAPLLRWPPTSIGSGADYSVDFNNSLSDGEYVAACEFGTDGIATQSWTSTFGNIVTVWLTWSASGPQTIPVCVLTSKGNTFQVDVSIAVSSEASLLTPVPPGSPNEASLASFKALYDAYRDSLPTADPGDGTSDWNNAGIIGKSVESS